MGIYKKSFRMNKIFSFVVLLFFAFSAKAQESVNVTKTSQEAAPKQKGIQFFQGSWAELLKESQQTGKPIFIDAYAAWCGPCRMMSANTFPDEEVGNYFNENFINYKLDMEKGEGPSVKMKYRVTQYPTYLFIDSQGNLKYRKVGYLVPDSFILEGKKAVEMFTTGN